MRANTFVVIAVLPSIPHKQQNSGPFGALARTIAGANARNSAEAVGFMNIEIARRKLIGLRLFLPDEIISA
jgi:hypothetical protein